jgi:hypothetical protein
LLSFVGASLIAPVATIVQTLERFALRLITCHFVLGTGAGGSFDGHHSATGHNTGHGANGSAISGFHTPSITVSDITLRALTGFRGTYFNTRTWLSNVRALNLTQIATFVEEFKCPALWFFTRDVVLGTGAGGSFDGLQSATGHNTGHGANEFALFQFHA